MAVFGLGGVGSFVVEALARSGIGQFILVDSDTVNLTNLNRQLIATWKTLDLPKVEVMKDRIADINPSAEVEIHTCFYGTQTAAEVDLSSCSYIVDCIDTVSSKILLVEYASRSGIPIMSSMGTGNKLDPTRFEIADIYSTSVCPLARIMRRELKKRNIAGLKVLYSREEPLRTWVQEEPGAVPSGRRAIPGSVPFVPPVAGLVIAGEVIKDLLK